MKLATFKIKAHRVAVTLALILMYSGVSAETVYYPEAKCAEIVSFEFSSGSGDTAFNQVDVLCKDAAGKYTGYVYTWATAAGFFGMGRVMAPERFDFVPYNGAGVKVE